MAAEGELRCIEICAYLPFNRVFVRNCVDVDDINS